MRIGIIGTGPAGITATVFATENENNEIVFFDPKPPFSTILPTGGGRCNLAYAEFDNRELVKFYPRGGKFLLSVFSRFSTGDTLELFEKMGIKTYAQEDSRIFPESNSAKEVRERFLDYLKKKNVSFVKEEVVSFEKIKNGFKVKTEKSSYLFDRLVFAGGIKNNYNLLKQAGIKLVEPRPALGSLEISEKKLYELSGVTLKNVKAKIGKNLDAEGDLLIAHSCVSGPLAYKIASLCAFCDFPYAVKLDFVGKTFEELDKELISLLNSAPKKNLANIVSSFVPHSFALYLSGKLGLEKELKAFQVDKTIRQNIAKLLCEYELEITGRKLSGEIVTAGGVDTDFVNAKTMEYKEVSGLYFCGEVLNVDGFTGGFNLQNCWSTGYLAGHALASEE